MSNTLANETHQRSLKDFLTLYNTITEYCFNKCISNFNERSAAVNEAQCVDTCTDNYVQYNQRFMFNFVDHQERRKKDQERLAIETAAKEAAAAQTAQPEQLTVSQEQQVQKSVELLETLSSATSSGLKSVSGFSPSEGAHMTQSSQLVEPFKGSTASAADVPGAAHHIENVNS